MQHSNACCLGPYVRLTCAPRQHLQAQSRSCAGKLCAAPLLRCAAALFSYVGDRLGEGKLAGPVAQEHGLMLRQLLLPVPEYCQEASVDAFSSMPGRLSS